MGCEMDANYLITLFLETGDISATIDEVADTGPKRTARRPRKRRFGGRGDAINPLTGKRKDPRKRLKARRTARRFAAKRKVALRKFTRSAKGKQFHKKLGKLAARIRR